MNFDPSCTWMINEEGGEKYTHDHPDPPTKFGVTLWTLRDVRGWKTTAEDVQALTLAEARQIYRDKYWDAMRCDDMPAGVDLMLFDCAVNPGPGFTPRALQQALGVRIDGKIGAITVAAAQQHDPIKLIEKLAEARLRYWLSRNNATEEKYERGWLARLVRCVMTAQAMATHQNPERLAALLPRA